MTGYRRIILTGGIGAGKSYVAERLADRGWNVIEADRIGHDVLEPGGSAFAAVVERWPSAVDEGTIDRAKLAHIVFSDSDQLGELESITHPAIRASILDQARSIAGDTLVEIPLLRDWFAGWPVVVVVAPLATRVSRLRARGMVADDIAVRMQNQPTDEQWQAAADYVIVNDGHRGLSDQLDGLDQFLDGFSVTGAR